MATLASPAPAPRPLTLGESWSRISNSFNGLCSCQICRCRLRGLRGDARIVECSYVASQVTGLPFFASKVRLGRSGIEEILPLGPLNEFERAGLEKAKKELTESIQKGVSFINK